MLTIFVIAGYFSINFAFLGQNLKPMAQAVRAAFDDGNLVHEDWLRGDTQIGHHQFNDCLVLAMALDQRGSAKQLTFSPARPTYDGETGQCVTLDRLARGEVPDNQPDYYHRYLHGHTLLVRIAAPALGVSLLRTTYKCANIFILMAGIGLSMIALARRRKTGVALIWLIFFVCFTRWFGVESFGQSLAHGPSDLVFLLAMLGFCAASLGKGISRRTAIVSASLFGVLTILLEFLSGGIPLGLALIIGAVPLALRQGESLELVRDTFSAVAAYCGAIVAGIVARTGATIFAFGPDAALSAARQLSVRMNMSAGGEALESRGPYAFARSIAKGLDGLVPGTRVMALLALVMAVLAGVWACKRLLNDSDPMIRVKSGMLLASNVAIFGWLLVFWQHTMIHAWFMDRILCWTIATGFALFGSALVRHQASSN